MNARQARGVARERRSNAYDAALGHRGLGHRVRKQNGEGARSTNGVGEQRRHVVRKLDRDFHRASSNEVEGGRKPTVDELARRERLGSELELPGLDACCIQNRLDHREKLAPATRHHLEALALPLRQLFVAEELGKTEDGVERTLEVVAHAREEQLLDALRRRLRGERALLRRRKLVKPRGEKVHRSLHLRHDLEATRSQAIALAALMSLLVGVIAATLARVLVR